MQVYKYNINEHGLREREERRMKEKEGAREGEEKRKGILTVNDADSNAANIHGIEYVLPAARRKEQGISTPL